MIIEELNIKGVFSLIPEIHSDNRGAFGRIFCRNELKKKGIIFDLIQMNHSITDKVGTIRGMHFQYPPKSEIKLIKCIKGAIYDVVIDLREGSPTFLNWHSIELSEDNMKMIYIPKGMAHGFQVLKQNSELIYLHSEFYSPENEGAIKYDDPIVGINWPLPATDVSERDRKHRYIDGRFKGIEI